MITRESVIGVLTSAVPEPAGVVSEHLTDNDEVLLRLLLSDLLRMTVSTFEAGQVDVTDRLLWFADLCLRDGDEYVANAVSVSFVEHFGVHAGEIEALLERWPEALRANLGR